LRTGFTRYHFDDYTSRGSKTTESIATKLVGYILIDLSLPSTYGSRQRSIYLPACIKYCEFLFRLHLFTSQSTGCG